MMKERIDADEYRLDTDASIHALNDQTDNRYDEHRLDTVASINALRR